MIMSKEIEKPAEAQAEVQEEVLQPDEPTQEEAVVEEVEEDKGPGKHFDFADIWFECGHCGHKNKLAEGLRGISFTVPATENAEMSMECSNCKTKLRMYFEESSEEVKELRRAELAKQEENGIDKENTEEESGSGDIENPERAPESNGEGATVSPTTDGDGSELEAKN